MSAFHLFVGVLVAAALSTSAVAQTPMSLDAFVTRANRIPLNASAMLRPDAYRLKTEAERAFDAIGAEIRLARSAGRTPPACPSDRITLNPRQLLAFLNAIPDTQRQRMSVIDGIRAWYADGYPCQ